MRDKDRIQRILFKLGRIWEEIPDIRFGQLISILFVRGKFFDIFYLDDEDLEHFIDCVIVENKY